MPITKPVVGAENWGATLNAALDDLEEASSPETLTTAIEEGIATSRLRALAPAWTTYGDSVAKASHPGIVAIGDSITDANRTDTTWTGVSLSRTSAYRADGFLVRAMIALRQRCSWHDVGISGETSADMLARFDADVVALAPHVVIEASGTNDVRSGRTAAAIKPDREEMWKKIYAYGGKVIATTVPPASDSDTAERKTAQNVNAWMREYALANPAHFALVDWYPDLVDPLTGGIKAAVMDTAGVHPNTLGALNVATKFATAIGKFIPETFDPLPSDNVNDDTCLITLPLLTGTTGGMAAPYTGVNASGWFGSCSATSAVGSKVARADGLGDWQQVVVTGVGLARLTRDLTALSWAVGDTIQAVMDFETDAASWADGEFSLQVICYAADNVTALHIANSCSVGADTLVRGRMTSGILRTPPIVVPVNTTKIQLHVVKTNAGTVRFSRVAVRKLV
jgi:lysophospholipase L1-like esterase